MKYPPIPSTRSMPLACQDDNRRPAPRHRPLAPPVDHGGTCIRNLPHEPFLRRTTRTTPGDLQIKDLRWIEAKRRPSTASSDALGRLLTRDRGHTLWSSRSVAAVGWEEKSWLVGISSSTPRVSPCA